MHSATESDESSLFSAPRTLSARNVSRDFLFTQPCSFFFFSSRRRHTRFDCDWSSDVCSSDLDRRHALLAIERAQAQRHEVVEQQLVQGEDHLGLALEKEAEAIERQLPQRNAEIGRASCRERV